MKLRMQSGLAVGLLAVIAVGVAATALMQWQAAQERHARAELQSIKEESANLYERYKVFRRAHADRQTDLVKHPNDPELSKSIKEYETSKAMLMEKIEECERRRQVILAQYPGAAQ